MRQARGFTLIELMIAIAIVSILAAIALPQYQNYVSRTRAAAAMFELSGYKSAISECIALQSTATGCSAGVNGIPPLPTANGGNITGWTSIVDGVITVTTGATDASTGLNLTVVNTPDASTSALITWTNSGTICDALRGLKPGQGDCPD